MNCWEVIGFEKWANDNNEVCRRVYVKRNLIPEEGHTGEGIETARVYYKVKYVNYEPNIGDLIAVVEGRYGIDQILVVGHV